VIEPMKRQSRRLEGAQLGAKCPLQLNGLTHQRAGSPAMTDRGEISLERSGLNRLRQLLRFRLHFGSPWSVTNPKPLASVATDEDSDSSFKPRSAPR
jgi:hypothetical protein